MLGWDDAIAFGLKLIDKVVPDPTEKARAQERLFAMKQAGEFKEIDAQLEAGRQQTEVNKIEAASERLFVAGWRPAVGWVCAAGFAYQFIAAPFLTWGAALAGHAVAMPAIDSAPMLTLLLGLLGLGGLRTFEKVKGVA